MIKIIIISSFFLISSLFFGANIVNAEVCVDGAGCAAQPIGAACTSPAGVAGFCSRTSTYTYSDGTTAPICGCQVASICVPSCSDANGNGEADDYVPDYACILSKTLVTPGSERSGCCENKCKEGGPAGVDPGDPNLKSFREITFFNTKIKLSYEKIPNLINIFFTTFLSIIAIYSLIRGIYVAGVKQVNSKTAEDNTKNSKELASLVIGFIIAFSFIFILQIIFSILGLGSITDLNINFGPDQETQGPQIVIE